MRALAAIFRSARGGGNETIQLPPTVGNIFKACYRLGQKLGNDLLYDVRKIVFFGLDELERVSRAADGSGKDYKAELEKLRDHIDRELKRLG